MNHLRRSWWKILATLVAFTLISAACGTGDSVGETARSTVPPGVIGGGGDQGNTDSGDGPVYGGRIIIGQEAETTGWLPGTTNFAIGPGTTVGLTIYDPLVALNNEGLPEPYLAESVEHNEALTEWTVKLRPGVKFHDGSDLTAEVLLWNYEEIHLAPGSTTQSGFNSFGVDRMEIVDDLTVVYILNAPNAAFPDLLRQPHGWPISRQAYEADPENYSENPVGTGPFMMKQWTRDDRLVVERNPNYWRTDADGNQLPYLNEIEFRPITDEDSRFQSLASDAIQVMVTLRGNTGKQVLQLIEQRDEHTANVSWGNTSGSSIFNVYEPPVDDVRVRRGLVAASDGDEIAAILGDDGLVPLTDGFFGSESGWYSESAGEAYLARNGAQMDLAQSYIDEYRNDPNRSDGRAVGEPLQVTYSCQPDPILIEIGQYYQAQWGSLGVEVALRTVEQAEHISNAVGSADQNPPWSGNFMINCWRHGAGEGDPLTAMQSFFGPPDSTPGNFTNFTHPEIDEALVTLRTSGDFGERYAAAETINRIANEQATQTWSIATPSIVGWRNDVVGLVGWLMPSGNRGNDTPTGHLNLSQVYLRP